MKKELDKYLDTAGLVDRRTCKAPCGGVILLIDRKKGGDWIDADYRWIVIHMPSSLHVALKNKSSAYQIMVNTSKGDDEANILPTEEIQEEKKKEIKVEKENILINKKPESSKEKNSMIRRKPKKEKKQTDCHLDNRERKIIVKFIQGEKTSDNFEKLRQIYSKHQESTDKDPFIKYLQCYFTDDSQGAYAAKREINSIFKDSIPKKRPKFN